MKTIDLTSLSTDLTTIPSDTIRKANAIARRAGHGRATSLIFGDQDRVIDHTAFGYRKKTTGEYVPNKYLANFGWKNTYYQCARTTVMVKA
jgi:hypothetical protein